VRLHRFYVGDSIKLTHDFWVQDVDLIHQWQKVFRLSAGAEIVLFDGKEHERLYKITKLEPGSTHVKHVTDLQRKTPKNNIYLFWSLLKKDKNDWVLQKCTELGVSHFVPLLSERVEKKGFDLERSRKIITEAAEQCGRGDIPSLREPMLLQTALSDYADKVTLYVCEQGSNEHITNTDQLGLLIGPEGGWTDKELELMLQENIAQLRIGDFTLRAETAAVAAIAKTVV
jgi:16S rRNA (uracil1498-N3)-methyltransferase